MAHAVATLTAPNVSTTSSLILSCVTFAAFERLDAGARDSGRLVAKWALDNMRDPRGYFWFQKHTRYTIKTSYVRWSQAWMLYGLARHIAGEVRSTNE